MSSAVALFICGLTAANGAFRGRQTGTIESLDFSKALSDMQPAVVAKLLTQVEARWKESRVASLRNQTDESEALAEMTKSCMKVAKAVIDGSEGDKNRVVEYMADVCSIGEAADKRGCESFAAGIENAMTNDVEVNRDSLDLNKFCFAYWQTTVTVDAKVEVVQSLAGNGHNQARIPDTIIRRETVIIAEVGQFYRIFSSNAAPGVSGFSGQVGWCW